MSQDSPGARERASTKRGRVVQIIISAVVVGAIFFYALPQVADFSSVWRAITDMTWLEAVTLLLAAAWNIVSYWLVMVAALPGSNVWQAMKVNGASTAITNTLPGGSALGIGATYGMYLSYGFDKPEVGLAVLVSGVWNNFVKLAMPVLALAFLALHGGASASTLTASIAGLAMLAAAVVIFAMMLYKESFARSIGSWLGSVRDFFLKVIRRPKGGNLSDASVRFRTDTIDLLRKRWGRLTLATIVSHLSLFAVLLLSLRHVGVSNQEVPWQEAFATFAFVRLITALPITPGGIGVVELGYTAALVAAGGERAAVVAGILVFRALTYLLPIPWGILMYLRWRQGASRRRERVALRHSAQSEMQAPGKLRP